MQFRVATWNLDHASNKSRPVDRQIDQIHSMDADIWVLSETCDKVDLSQVGYRSATPERRNKYQNFWTTVWVHPRFSIGKNIRTHDGETVTCIEVETPKGQLTVYGTILTWRDDRGTGGTSDKWVEHHKAINAHGDDWARLQNLHRGTPMIIAGDFNQTRDGSRRYCSVQSIEMLSTQLTRNNLVCVTEEDFGKEGKLGIDPKKGYYRHNIDHICLTPPLQASCIGVWDHFSREQELSDHNGVFADVVWRS
jgi:endonuclease/exonuclease/phosphatase family metal-dependent hydrolase